MMGVCMCVKAKAKKTQQNANKFTKYSFIDDNKNKISKSTKTKKQAKKKLSTLYKLLYFKENQFNINIHKRRRNINNKKHNYT